MGILEPVGIVVGIVSGIVGMIGTVAGLRRKDIPISGAVPAYGGASGYPAQHYPAHGVAAPTQVYPPAPTTQPHSGQPYPTPPYPNQPAPQPVHPGPQDPTPPPRYPPQPQTQSVAPHPGQNHPGQPQPGQPQLGTTYPVVQRPKMQTNLVAAWLSAVLFYLAAPAVVYGYKARRAYLRGEYAAADRAFRISRRWSRTTFVVVALYFVGAVIYTALHPTS